MKHFLFLLFITVCTSVVAIAVPFWGVLLYYAYATLRPQYLWDWSLSSTPQVRWSLTAGLVALVATAVNLPTILRSFRGNKVMVLLFVYAALMLLSLLTAYDPKVATRTVGRAIVDNEQFVGPSVREKCAERLDGFEDRAFLVVGGNDKSEGRIGHV